MPTESSAVSNLIHSLQTRRLQTDPGTASLFQPAPAARAPRVQPVRPVAPSSRWFEHTPPTIAKPQPRPQPHAQPRARARKRRRDRTWLLIVATLLAGGIGVAGAAYYPFDSSDDDVAAFVPPVIVPAPAAVAPAPAAAPSVTPIAEPSADAITSAEPPPTETTPAPAAAPEPAKPHRRAHAKKKHAVAKHVKAPKAAPAAEPADEEAPPPPPPPAVHHGPTRQSDDSENPL